VGDELVDSAEDPEELDRLVFGANSEFAAEPSIAVANRAAEAASVPPVRPGAVRPGADAEGGKSQANAGPGRGTQEARSDGGRGGRGGGSSAALSVAGLRAAVLELGRSGSGANASGAGPAQVPDELVALVVEAAAADLVPQDTQASRSQMSRRCWRVRLL
jgi:hypothetical protein